jgi:hypothetical protein
MVVIEVEGALRRQGKRFFFEKKKQKTFSV